MASASVQSNQVPFENIEPVPITPIDNSPDNASGDGSLATSSRPSLLTRLLSSMSDRFHNDDQEQSYLGIWTAKAILINFISVGYVLNPSGFAQGGLLLGSICLALVSLQSSITGNYVLEACARAEAWMVSVTESKHIAVTIPVETPTEMGEEEPSAGDPEDPPGVAHVLVDTIDNAATASSEATSSALLPTEAIAENATKVKKSKKKRRFLPRGHSFMVHQRTYELSELCRIFMGRWLRNFFTFTLAGDLYGITWTFAAVFGSSLSQHLPMGTDYDYQIYVLIFMAVTIPTSCTRFTLQVPFQLLFLIARTLMLYFMLGTLFSAYVSGNSHFGSQLQPVRETPLAHFSKIVTLLQTCVFSTAFQFSVPGLTAETQDKGTMVHIMNWSVSYIYITNLVLSIIMAIYFGSNTQDSSNLNWLYYHGGTWNGEGDFTRPGWATAISSYIVLFAAIDGLAVYPLISISLGDIFMGAVYEEEVHRIQENWKIRMLFRLAACVPQAIGSLFLKDLGVIAKYAGIFTLLSYTICPSLLFIMSSQFLKDCELPCRTEYNTLFSSAGVAWILIGAAICLIIGVVVEAITL